LGQNGGVALVVFPQFVETGPGFIVAIAGQQGAGKLLDRLHIVPRVVLDGLEEIRDGFVPLVHPREGHAVVLEDFRVAGLDFERAGEALDRFVPAHQRGEDDAEIVVRFRVIGIALERMRTIGQASSKSPCPIRAKPSAFKASG
jgi:KaiC/GvpD/RAD55 family RecA-like ATPase